MRNWRRGEGTHTLNLAKGPRPRARERLASRTTAPTRTLVHHLKHYYETKAKEQIVQQLQNRYFEFESYKTNQLEGLKCDKGEHQQKEQYTRLGETQRASKQQEVRRAW